MLNGVQNLAPGLLIAMPQLGDSNFHRAVVLMVEHSETGSLGLVLNRPSPVTLRELSKGQGLKLAAERADEVVFVGGPVEPQRGFVLHDNPQVIEKHELAPGLFLSVTLDALGPLLADPSHRLRFCLGYAGWGPRQVETEITAGAWLFNEVGAESVLGDAPEQMWETSLHQMGVDPAMLQTGRGVN